jgi:hypothetical protein
MENDSIDVRVSFAGQSLEMLQVAHTVTSKSRVVDIANKIRNSRGIIAA